MSTSSLFLSGCLIVKNEAANLKRCLTSIQPYVDELIIVDTGSTDDTVAIAQSFGATVHYFDWCDDFAAARNFALSKVQGEWILMLDADEELNAENPNWVQTLNEEKRIQAFTVALKAPDQEVTVLQAIRLFRNNPKLRYAGRYHEHLLNNGLPLEESMMRLLPGVKITHYGYDLEILPQKSLDRIPILEEIRRTEGLDLMLLWTLSGMYECTQQWQQSQDCYEEAMERLFPSLLTGEKPSDLRAVRSWLYGLGEKVLEQEDFESLRLICLHGLNWFPAFPPLYYLTGLMIKQLGFNRGAIPYFQACVEFGKSDRYFKGEPFDTEILGALSHFELGTIFQQLGNINAAIHRYEQALSCNSAFIQAREAIDMLSTETKNLSQADPHSIL